MAKRAPRKAPTKLPALMLMISVAPGKKGDKSPKDKKRKGK